MIQLNTELPRVLVIEDDPADIELISSAIEENGGPVAFQYLLDGTEAIFLLRQLVQGPRENLPDLIILDLNLPMVNGQDVLNYIKRQAELSEIPTIVLSGANSPQVHAQCVRLGADAYLVKPSRLQDWQEKLLQLEPLLRKKRSA